MTKPSEWDDIYQLYSGRVRGYIMARVQRREDAEDLCADVFEKAFRKMGDYDENRAAIGTWIYSITRNTVIDYFRKTRPTAELDENMAADQEIDQSLLKKETLEELAAAVEKLPPDLQNIIVLAYYERMPLVEITKWVHYSYRTVKLKHKKALELLRESLEKE